MMTKKIMIIDGGPRKNFNTASMLQKFAEGAMSVGNDIEVKTVRLYGIDYKGCMSCMACKIKGKASNVCKFKDALTPVLEEIAHCLHLNIIADRHCTLGKLLQHRGRVEILSRASVNNHNLLCHHISRFECF